MAVFTGAGVAIATPFDENYNIDYESFGKFIDFQMRLSFVEHLERLLH